MSLKVGILIISDTASKDRSQDLTGPALTTYLQSLNFRVVHLLRCPDDKEEIQANVTHLAREERMDVVFTSGGTGFTKRDVTPEAVGELLEKLAPGVVQAMMSKSLAVTPFAMCARPVAGVIDDTLVVTLPGSKKGALENVEAIKDAVGHICAQLKTDSARDLHKEIAQGTQTTHTHSHEHHRHHHSHYHGHAHGGVKRHVLSNALNAPVTERARKSPYPMIPVAEALSLINKHTPPSKIVTKSITDPDITGHIIAEDIYASIDVPSFDASIVDGYAVICADCPGTYHVKSVSHARPGSALVLTSGEIARVTTGAPLPRGTQAVIPVEETLIVSTKVVEETEEEDEIQILAEGVQVGDNVRLAGSDISRGQLALKKGTQITAVGGEIGLLASIGVMSVECYAKPVIGVLSTGDEVVDLKEKRELEYGEIFDTNRPLLMQLLQGWGFATVDLGIASDVAGSLEQALGDAMVQHDLDYVITTGGVSMGEKDLMKPVIERELGGVIHFGRVAMKPGKPTTFATVSVGERSRAIFALPGNPASAAVTTNLFVLPSLRKFSGFGVGDELPTLPEIEVELSQDTRLDPRPEYQRVRVSQRADGTMVAESTGFQRSSRVGSVVGANALAVLPSSKDVPEGRLPRGTRVRAMLIALL